MENLDLYSWMLVFSNLSEFDLIRSRAVSKKWKILSEAELKIRKEMNIRFEGGINGRTVDKNGGKIEKYWLRINGRELSKCLTPAAWRKNLPMFRSLSPNLENISIALLDNENMEFFLTEYKHSIKKLTIGFPLQLGKSYNLEKVQDCKGLQEIFLIGLSNVTDTELNGIIKSCKQLVKIRLERLPNVTGSFITNLNNFTEKLAISSKCGGIQIRELENLKHKKLDMLRTLKFDISFDVGTFNKQKIQNVFDYICQNFPNLEHLFYDVRKHDSTIVWRRYDMEKVRTWVYLDFSEIKRLKKLKRWTSPRQGVYDYNFMQVINNCPSTIEHLDLSKWSLVGDESLIYLPLLCPCLKIFELCSDSMTNLSFDAFAKFKELVNLKIFTDCETVTAHSIINIINANPNLLCFTLRAGNERELKNGGLLKTFENTEDYFKDEYIGRFKGNIKSPLKLGVPIF